MDAVQVSSEGLQTLATQHGSVSAELASSTARPTPGPPSQATSAAVADGYGALETSAVTLAARVEATASKLSTAGTRYTASDHDSAQRIAAVSQSLEI